jgi:ribose-phosphate pyrophosphokinase
LKSIIFPAFPPSKLTDNVIKKNPDLEYGDADLHYFPDGEIYLKINSDLENKNVIVMTSLNNPNEKILPLLFFSRAIKKSGANKVGLIAPYLAYMRQDKQFNPGECITSHYFAEIISQHFDWLMTIDPHLHRYKSLQEIYTIPTITLHAKEKIFEWILNNIENPIIIGPDVESKQWAENKAGIPYLILQKIRRGARDVTISIPKINNYQSHTFILIDDIISTARTMIETVKHLKERSNNSIVCLGIHAVFAKNAYQELIKSGCDRIITCNTIDHTTNTIDLSTLIINALPV